MRSTVTTMRYSRSRSHGRPRGSPGPTNGGLDLSEKDRWLITGSPFVQFRFKDPILDLEARLRKIILRTIPKVGPELATQLIAMLEGPVDHYPVCVRDLRVGFGPFRAGPAAALALVLDCVSLAVLGIALAK